jgi:hypothetical protein
VKVAIDFGQKFEDISLQLGIANQRLEDSRREVGELTFQIP